MAHLIDDKTVAKMGHPKLDVSHPASGDVDCRCFVAGGYEVESWVVSSKSFPYLLALIYASAFPGTNTLNRNSAVSSLKTLRSEEALGLPCDEADYSRDTGFAARMPSKLWRYCRKTSTHSTQATSAGGMPAGAKVR